VVLPNSAEWETLRSHFPTLPGARQIIVVDIDRVQTSCGTGVPLYSLVEQRRSLIDWAVKKGEAGLQDYRQLKNRVSIDGLPTPLAAVPAGAIEKE
jgi:hypothetical protein